MQPVCSREECRQEGANWLKSEGLVAAMSDVQRVVNPLCTVALPEPARVPVRAMDQGQKVEGSETVAPTEGLSVNLSRLGGLMSDPASLQYSSREGSETVVPTEGLSGTPEGPARQAQQVGRARDPASLQYSSREGSEAVVPTEGLSSTPEGPACQAHQAGRARYPASLQDSSRSQQGLHRGANREAREQPSTLGTLSVPEPARAMVRATDQRQ